MDIDVKRSALRRRILLTNGQTDTTHNRIFSAVELVGRTFNGLKKFSFYILD